MLLFLIAITKGGTSAKACPIWSCNNLPVDLTSVKNFKDGKWENAKQSQGCA